MSFQQPCLPRVITSVTNWAPGFQAWNWEKWKIACIEEVIREAEKVKFCNKEGRAKIVQQVQCHLGSWENRLP